MRFVSIFGVLLLAGCSAQAAPAAAPAAASVIGNCGRQLSVAAPPARAVAMEQNATEILLSLGLADRMAGTSYQTDPVLPALAAAYARVPVLAKLYPSREKVLETRPDFVYSTFTSAYAPDAAGPRAGLAELGIPAYLSRFACESSPETFSFDGLFQEIQEVASIFGADSRGASLVADQKARLAAATSRAHDAASVLWYYSGTSTPYVAGPGGVPAAISAQLGLTNVYADAGETWPAGNWEQIATRNPAWIVVADLSRGGDGDSAQSKIGFLRSNPVTAHLDAVKNGRFVVVPGSSLDPSVRNVSAVELVGAAL
ncbi:ABC transporter substrate-binding protein [Paractinoplanes brasiliensis]|uniref:Iron complex transport system substrate-binding protein n=1 Tax=Paractinoplanes brasiliensis TaxID=52695 RepID=A0A4R6JQZ7_9ACTN|nr:ABC transporter substrate-binding protein [Actinoplanes brasiliensis]TDO37316.1 iron complex transport system substrate-binding protein [Actinoplanes brasiliensis]